MLWEVGFAKQGSSLLLEPEVDLPLKPGPLHLLVLQAVCLACGTNGVSVAS